MTTLADKDRSHESVINDTLARFLRERCGLSAVAETLHNGRRPDIIVRLPEDPVVLETELEPARTVEADALSRLGMELDGQAGRGAAPIRSRPAQRVRRGGPRRHHRVPGRAILGRP